MAEIAVNIIGLLISAFLFIFSRDFSVSTRPGVPSAAFFPTIISAILLFLSILNLVKYIIARKKGEAEDPAPIGRAKMLQFFELVVLLFLYAVLWYFHIGHFILNTVVIFTVVCWLLSDETEWWKSALFVLGVTIFIYCLFVLFLRVRLW